MSDSLGGSQSSAKDCTPQACGAAANDQLSLERSPLFPWHAEQFTSDNLHAFKRSGVESESSGDGAQHQPDPSSALYKKLEATVQQNFTKEPATKEDEDVQ
ncbi:hypothetical protein AMS68_003529 [Peltaster fructicola]|uniref:Uncharacterized protein n=1 Tax=Peltaster fructicola TaxID=286661 RepID=A0A6H0XTB6_9PEZI|nr:hypothetical protein AMS68_003529 [Peltaster fructicola]